MGAVFAIDHDLVGGFRVSTVEIDLENGETFETIVFNERESTQEWRWEDRDDAVLGHDAVVVWMRTGGPEPYPEQRVM